ncbi:hypothetical protein FACS1894199_15960 [Bacteroidia bacterium]|nr:hypothetical protein FACS1894199_15960 [Bacteroidia bacterium]
MRVPRSPFLYTLQVAMNVGSCNDRHDKCKKKIRLYEILRLFGLFVSGVSTNVSLEHPSLLGVAVGDVVEALN